MEKGNEVNESIDTKSNNLHSTFDIHEEWFNTDMNIWGSVNQESKIVWINSEKKSVCLLIFVWCYDSLSEIWYDRPVYHILGIGWCNVI